MKKSVAALAALLLCTSPVLAQTGPGGVPLGAGEQRGVQGLNNSGQTGFVTLFDHGRSTAIVVYVEGTEHRVERVTIQRGKCDAIDPKVVANLPNLRNKISRGTIRMTQSRLLSGNYVAVVYSSPLPSGRQVACGELYH